MGDPRGCLEPECGAAKIDAMRYMVIETFRDAPAIYRRFAEKGRMMPEGLSYIESWISEDVRVCYQLMEAGDPELLREWTRNWDDLMDFEIVPVISSAEARERSLR